MKIIDTFTTCSKSGNIKTFEKIDAFGYRFIIEVPKSGIAKIKKDIAIVENILSLDEITHADRMHLLWIYNVAHHDSGKIEDVNSLDSSATNCGFCAKMREYAAAHPELKIVCGECYDYKQEQYRYSALNRHTLNLVIMESVEFTIEELSMLPAGELIRVNSSGDSSGNVYAANMIKYCIAHPTSHCAIWAKNAVSYIHACDKYGKPKNVVMIQSSPFVDREVKRAKYFDYVFTVYKDAEKVKAALANGACECNGKKCKNCDFKCYKKLWPVGSNIAELLRK